MSAILQMAVISLLLSILYGSTPASAQNTTASLTKLATTGNYTAQYKLYKFQGCHDNKKQNDQKAILDALKEANNILGADGNYYIDGYWSSMNMIEFFGNPPDLKQNQLRKGLKKNLLNAYRFTNGWWFSGETTAVYCHDGSLPDKDGVEWSKACGSADFPAPIVVAPNYHGNERPALMFCDDWFRLSRLDDAIKSGKSEPYNGAYDLGNYENRARAWITAMMLLPTIGVHPKSSDGNPAMGYIKYAFSGRGQPGSRFAITAAQCKWATKAMRDVTYGFTNNADSISWYALASYVQKEMGEYPIKPYVPADVVF